MRVWLVGVVCVLGMTACGEIARVQDPFEQAESAERTSAPGPIPPAQAFARWPQARMPEGADGTQVVAFASGLQHPRALYVLPNGDVLAAESSRALVPGERKPAHAQAGGEQPGAARDRIVLLRDTDGDGIADLRSVFIDDLHLPFGMALIGNRFYVANTDELVWYPYREGQLAIRAPDSRVTELPAGEVNYHWMRNLAVSPDSNSLFVSVGSNSDVGENGMDSEQERAAIWSVDLESGAHTLYATGLRNPVGMAWELENGSLWVTVDERDRVANEPAPDYLTAVREDAFYGWPYSFSGKQPDARAAPQKPDLVAAALAPDYELGAHASPMALVSAIGNTLPARFAHGMFVAEHGLDPSDAEDHCKVVFVPFEQAKPAGEPATVLSGFLDQRNKPLGCPAGLAIDSQGALLVADDMGGTIWRVTSAPGGAQP